jgi:riboflavin biosynthesis pyrimidine reductase
MLRHKRRSPQFVALRTLLETTRGRALPLPPTLSRLYGAFRLPMPRARWHVFSNFVSTLDGVVSLQVKGHSGGGDISGFSGQDRMVMGLLRAAADAVIVGAGTLAADPEHLWTPQAICPELGEDFRRLADAMAKPRAALNVIVSAGGTINLRLPVFASGKVPAMIITTERGAKQLQKHRVPDALQIRAIRSRSGEIPAAEILRAVGGAITGKRILVEGGPRLLGTFYKARLVDEQFLSLAPQLSGREPDDARMSLVMGETFAPRDPLWGQLLDVRQGSRLLFLRYSFGK